MQGKGRYSEEKMTVDIFMHKKDHELPIKKRIRKRRTTTAPAKAIGFCWNSSTIVPSLLTASYISFFLETKISFEMSRLITSLTKAFLFFRGWP